MLHETDKSRLKQQYVCTTCGEIVERDSTIRGFEYARGQYVVLSDDELKALEVKSDRSIEIEEFVPIEQVDPMYFDRSNLLGPDKGGYKAYKLLRDAMAESGKVAVGRYATRGRQQLVLIRPVEEGLVLHALYYADEVRNFEDIELGDEDVSLREGELDLAKQLIEQLAAGKFEPDKYEDEYRKDVLQAVDRKVAGEEVVAMPAPEAREQIIDLVAALKQSLAEKRKGRPDEEAEPARASTQSKAKAPRRKAASR